MKKLLCYVFAFIYLFTSSSLVHASTMGFFDISHAAHHKVAHCHLDAPETSQKSNQNMSCCELFSSDEYSQTNINFKNSIKLFYNNDAQVNPVNHIYGVSQKISKHKIAFSPGGQTSWGKYHKFSDLYGIIVKTI